MTNIADRVVQAKAEGEWSYQWRPHNTETATTTVTASHRSRGREDTTGRPNHITISTRTRSTIGNERIDEINFDREGAVGLIAALGKALDWDGRTQLEHDLQRKDDVIGELRRQVESLDKQLKHLRKGE